MTTQGLEATSGHDPHESIVRSWSAAHAFWFAVGGVSALAAAFLAHQLMAWPPHEDETLALFVGRDSLPGVVEHVTRERGGAPLHFLVAWVVAHLGFGLGGLRLASAVFAVASLPLTALLGLRLVSREVALAATALLATSWILLFHGVYGRMYSLFLALSLLALIALLAALDRNTRTTWALWVLATLAMVAAHPYGLLVIGGQVLYVLVERRERIRSATWALAAVAAMGIPFWLTDLVLAGRFDVELGAGDERLGGPLAIGGYLWRTAGDMSAGWWPVTALAVALAGLGLVTEARAARVLTLCALAVPALALLLSRMGGSASPESRHLIFLAPLFAISVAAGIVRLAGRSPVAVGVVVAALAVVELGWAWERTAPLFTWEPDQRQAARAEAETWLATTGRGNDVLFGYEPLYLGAWERDSGTSAVVVPRADSVLALRTLRRVTPLGRGVWVFDASRRNNDRPRLELGTPPPAGTGMLQVRAFGPFLVLRTVEPTRTPNRYLTTAARAQLIGRGLGIGDADVNLQTVERAARVVRGYGPSLWLRSSVSR